MDEILQSVNSLLAEVLAEMTNGSSQYIGVAKLIAGVGALILSLTTFSQIMSGKIDEPIGNFTKRILLISLGIGYYGVFLSFINAPLNIMTQSIKEVVAIDHEKTENFFETYTFNQDDEFSNNPEDDAAINGLLTEAETVVGSDNDDDSSGLSGVVMGIFNGSYQDNIRLWIMEAFYQIIHFLGIIAVIVLNVIRTFFLIVLSTFGIFVIAFCMYPGLENSFFQWLQKYINVYLWLPISYILQGLISKIFTMIKPDMGTTIFTSNAQEMSNAGDNIIVALIGICSVVAFATVPTLSSWMVNAATTSMGSKVKGKTMDAGKSGAKAAKTAAAVKTGGASAAATAAMGK